MLTSELLLTLIGIKHILPPFFYDITVVENYFGKLHPIRCLSKFCCCPKHQIGTSSKMSIAFRFDPIKRWAKGLQCFLIRTVRLCQDQKRIPNYWERILEVHFITLSPKMEILYLFYKLIDFSHFSRVSSLADAAHMQLFKSIY